MTIDRDVSVKINLFKGDDLSYYARDNIPNYQTITEIPKEHMDYINSVKYAVSCDSMFFNCKKLATIDISKFDTRYVTNMGSMFMACYNLSVLDLSNFDTSNVTDMGHMFWSSSLTTLDLSSFNTSNVTDMGHMFGYCYKLTTLDLSNFDTSKVTDMGYMFNHCKSLTTLDLSNFDTSKVTDMEYMFWSSSLTTIKGTLDLSSCKHVDHMFDDSPNIKGVHLKNVPRSLLGGDGSIYGAGGTLNKTYIIDNILEDK